MTTFELPSSVDLPALRISTPAALVKLLPDLIGFLPEESLVVVFIKDDTVIVSMRLNLEGASHEVNAYVVATARRVGADTALITTHTSDPSDPLAFAWLVVGVSAALADTGITVRDCLAVVGDRFWSYQCQDDSCCDPDGTPVDQGRTLSRDEIRQRYLPRPGHGPSMEDLDRAVADADPDLLIRCTQAWNTLQNLSTSGPSRQHRRSTDRARLLVWCQHVHVRDFLMCSLAAAPDGAHHMVDTIVDLALAAPVELRCRMAGMAAALLAAFEPSTVPASCLVDLAEEDSLARLVAASIEMAVPPMVLRDMLASGLDNVLEAIDSSQQN